MNIVHVCVCCPYTDYWGYQENLLPKYQKKMGHNVTVITTNTKHSDADGSIVETETGDYILNDGVRVIRLNRSKLINKKLSEALSYYKIYDLLCNLKPDLIMVHSLNTITSLQVVKYVKNENNNCTVIADSHEDFNNSKVTGGIKFKVLTFIRRAVNKYMLNYYTKIFCITPSCEKMAIDYYGIHKEKVELLPLGCDSDMINFYDQKIIRNRIRNKFNISESDILIVTGGKLDEKKNTHSLMNAVLSLSGENVKLVVFGNATTEHYDRVLKSIVVKAPNDIKLIGQLSLSEIYNLFLSADLAIFPGSQSALWQQAIGSGLPVMVKRWDMIDYLDFGGNIKFLEKADEIEIKGVLEQMINKPSIMDEMKSVALDKGIEYLSYESIAQKVINCKL